MTFNDVITKTSVYIKLVYESLLLAHRYIEKKRFNKLTKRKILTAKISMRSGRLQSASNRSWNMRSVKWLRQQQEEILPRFVGIIAKPSYSQKNVSLNQHTYEAKDKFRDKHSESEQQMDLIQETRLSDLWSIRSTWSPTSPAQQTMTKRSFCSIGAIQSIENNTKVNQKHGKARVAKSLLDSVMRLICYKSGQNFTCMSLSEVNQNR